MDLREGLLAAATQLGVSPLDLATIVSYETAGSLDPLKRGPRTQWGRHQGLIQWGQPQAKKYLGGDFSIPSQSKGIVSYMRDAGVKPGMGMMDLYSAVNAGRVGRYNASDANNGGAPGTVRDKVNNQMAGHRKNAERLIGNGGPPPNLAGIGSPNIAPPVAEPQTAAKQGLLGGLSPEEAAAFWGEDGKEKKGLLSRLSAGLKAVPDAPTGHLGGFEDARRSGSLLLEALTNPTVTRKLAARRFR